MSLPNSDILRIRTENQAKLSPIDRIAITRMCLDRHIVYMCTKQHGHQGDHVAHGSLGTIIERWPATIDV